MRTGHREAAWWERRQRRQRIRDVGAHDRWTRLGAYAVKHGEQYDWSAPPRRDTLTDVANACGERSLEPVDARMPSDQSMVVLSLRVFAWFATSTLPPPTQRDREALGAAIWSNWA